MERQDHLMRQIDQLAAVLQRLLADLVNVPIDNATVDRTMEQLNEVMALDPAVVKSGPPHSIHGLLSDPAFTFANTEMIADLYRAMADGLTANDETQERALQLRQHALAILEYLHANDTTYSFTRQGKIAALRGQL
ncbi:MAG: hypothetical protein R2818_02775 [Flavobacteriales bacterium]